MRMTFSFKNSLIRGLSYKLKPSTLQRSYVMGNIKVYLFVKLNTYNNMAHTTTTIQ